VAVTFFRDPIVLIFLDEGEQELARITTPAFVPRLGENVRLHRVPYRVIRVGYDIADSAIERILVVCVPT
jgi:hypothetical protein